MGADEIGQSAYYTIDVEDNIFVVAFKPGIEITMELIIDAIDNEISMIETESINDVWDFRGCEVNKGFTYESMERIVHHIKWKKGDLWHNRTAIIVEDDLFFGMSRMFEAAAFELPFKIRAFHDESKAKAWAKSLE